MAEKRMITVDADVLDRVGAENVSRILNEAIANEGTDHGNETNDANAKAAAVETNDANNQNAQANEGDAGNTGDQNSASQSNDQNAQAAAEAPKVLQLTQEQLDKAIEAGVSRKVAGLVAQTGIQTGQAIGSQANVSQSEAAAETGQSSTQIDGEVATAKEDAEAIWKNDASIRDEFQDQNAFAAYLRNYRSGNIKISDKPRN